MNHLNLSSFFMAVLLMMVGIFMPGGCDSGEKVVDKVTGNEDIKQYHKLKKDIGEIADQQVERYNKILDEKKVLLRISWRKPGRFLM